MVEVSNTFEEVTVKPNPAYFSTESIPTVPAAAVFEVKTVVFGVIAALTTCATPAVRLAVPVLKGR